MCCKFIHEDSIYRKNDVFHDVANGKCNKTVNSKVWFSKLCHRDFSIQSLPFLVFFDFQIFIKMTNFKSKNLCDKSSKIKILRWQFSCIFRWLRRGIPRFFCRRRFHGDMTETKSPIFKIFIKNINFFTDQDMIEAIAQNCAKTKAPTKKIDKIKFEEHGQRSVFHLLTLI